MISDERVTPAEAIEALKAEIERYEVLSRTELVWAFMNRREEGARATRDIFLLAFHRIAERLRDGNLKGALEVVEYTEGVVFEPGTSTLRSEWVHGREGASEDPTPTEEVVRRRQQAASELYRRFAPPF